MEADYAIARIARELFDRLKQSRTSYVTVAGGEIEFHLRQAGLDARAESGAALEEALLMLGVRCHPSPANESAQSVRIFYIGTVIASMVDMLSDPNPKSDRDLTVLIQKVRGLWDWHQRPRRVA